jgi:SsrA-binding protein
MAANRPKAKVDGEIKVLVRNRRALHDYAIEERLEAGLVLLGSEVKSLREARATLTDAHVVLRGGEAWLVNLQINEYPWANRFNHDVKRERKLLLHRRELARLDTRINQRGYTVVPLSLYLKGGRVKAELAVGRGKREYEKRESSRERDARREIEQALRRRR